MEVFDYLIVGDEVAGLWYAAQLTQVLAPISPAPRIGWISLERNPRRVLINRATANAFSIPVTGNFSPEFLFPKRSFRWQREIITKRFPLITEEIFQSLEQDPLRGVRGRTESALRHALTNYPELFGYAQAMWRVFGRTSGQGLTEENLLAQALLNTDVFWWDPVTSLPGSIQKLRPVVGGIAVEQINFTATKQLCLSFSSSPPLQAKQWVFAASVDELKNLCAKSAELSKLLGLNDLAQGRDFNARYSFSVRAGGQSIPSPCGPMTLTFDTEAIPDPVTEVWPFFLSRTEKEAEITLQALAPSDVALETTLENFAQGMKRLNQTFPFLAQNLLETSVPISMETCFSQEQREKASVRLEKDRTDLFAVASLTPHTRNHSVHVLSPSLGCHLPYPAGPLIAAQKLSLEEKKARKKDLKIAAKRASQESAARHSPRA